MPSMYGVYITVIFEVYFQFPPNTQKFHRMHKMSHFQFLKSAFNAIFKLLQFTVQLIKHQRCYPDWQVEFAWIISKSICAHT